jgi:hypothetical protein
MTTTEKVRNYKGNNNFINSLRNGLIRYGKLTDRQMAAADKFFVKTEQPKKEVEVKPINVDVDIKVTRFIAKRIKEDNELEFAPFMLTISKVLGETAKAYKVVGKMTTSDVTSCRCCGRDLTDYVKKQEDVEVYKKLLKLKIDQIGDLTFWLAKSQIVEGGEDLSEVVK